MNCERPASSEQVNNNHQGVLYQIFKSEGEPLTAIKTTNLYSRGRNIYFVESGRVLIKQIVDGTNTRAIVDIINQGDIVGWEMIGIPTIKQQSKEAIIQRGSNIIGLSIDRFLDIVTVNPEMVIITAQLIARANKRREKQLEIGKRVPAIRILSAFNDFLTPDGKITESRRTLQERAMVSLDSVHVLKEQLVEAHILSGNFKNMELLNPDAFQHALTLPTREKLTEYLNSQKQNKP